QAVHDLLVPAGGDDDGAQSGASGRREFFRAGGGCSVSAHQCCSLVVVAWVSGVDAAKASARIWWDMRSRLVCRYRVFSGRAVIVLGTMSTTSIPASRSQLALRGLLVIRRIRSSPMLCRIAAAAS